MPTYRVVIVRDAAVEQRATYEVEAPDADAAEDAAQELENEGIGAWEVSKTEPDYLGYTFEVELIEPTTTNKHE
jgi:hypothetical protein